MKQYTQAKKSTNQPETEMNAQINQNTPSHKSDTRDTDMKIILDFINKNGVEIYHVEHNNMRINSKTRIRELLSSAGIDFADDEFATGTFILGKKSNKAILTGIGKEATFFM
jgi:hypothetical protein